MFPAMFAAYLIGALLIVLAAAALVVRKADRPTVLKISLTLTGMLLLVGGGLCAVGFETSPGYFGGDAGSAGIIVLALAIITFVVTCIAGVVRLIGHWRRTHAPAARIVPVVALVVAIIGVGLRAFAGWQGPQANAGIAAMDLVGIGLIAGALLAVAVVGLRALIRGFR